MSVEVRCDHCGRVDDLQRMAVGTFALPLGWSTPRDDDQRRVFGRCREVCSSGCVNELYETFSIATDPRALCGLR